MLSQSPDSTSHPAQGTAQIIPIKVSSHPENSVPIRKLRPDAEHRTYSTRDDLRSGSHSAMRCEMKSLNKQHTSTHGRAMAPAPSRQLPNADIRINSWLACMTFLVNNLTPGQLQQGLAFRRGYVLEYLVVNRIVLKRVLLKWFKLRQVHGPNKSVR